MFNPLFIFGIFRPIEEFDFEEEVRNAMEARNLKKVEDVVLYATFEYFFPVGTDWTRPFEKALPFISVDFWMQSKEDESGLDLISYGGEPNWRSLFDQAMAMEEKAIADGVLRRKSDVLRGHQVGCYIRPYEENGKILILSYFYLKEDEHEKND